RWWSDITNVFSGLYHSVINWWHSTWAEVKSLTATSISTVVGYFQRLPGQVLGALKRLGSELFSVGKTALTDLWHGVTSVGHSIIGWFGNFAKDVVGVFRKIWGWFSPSSLMYQAGRDLMLGLSHGIRDHAHLAMNHASMTARGIASVAGPGSSSAAIAYA